jgi:hypothetical protein
MSIRMLILALVSALLAACTPPAEEEAAPRPEPLTAAHVADLIAADGAAHTIAVLTGPADPTGIDKVFTGVATGDPAWLALVPLIEPETDGLHAEGLQDALATALTHNAAGVLALWDHVSPVFVCAATTPPDARTTTGRAAVAAVTDPALQRARAECLREFDGA